MSRKANSDKSLKELQQLTRHLAKLDRVAQKPPPPRDRNIQRQSTPLTRSSNSTRELIRLPSVDTGGNATKPLPTPEEDEAALATPQSIGSQTPSSRITTSRVFQRAQSVRETVLRQAAGICDCCKNSAPFRCPDNSPYLEVHHVIPLSEGGPDTIENTVALCANCHRELHHGREREVLVSRLYESVTRLKRS